MTRKRNKISEKCPELGIPVSKIPDEFLIGDTLNYSALEKRFPDCDTFGLKAISGKMGVGRKQAGNIIETIPNSYYHMYISNISTLGETNFMLHATHSNSIDAGNINYSEAKRKRNTDGLIQWTQP